jgi:hypothetical protein
MESPVDVHKEDRQAIRADRRRAWEASSEAIRLEPHFVDGYCQRARIALLLKEYDRALADATTALRLTSGSRQAYQLHLQACSRQQKVEPSVGLFVKQGLLLLQEGEYGLAWESGQRALQMVLH